MPPSWKIFFFFLSLFDPSIALQAETKSERVSAVLNPVVATETAEAKQASKTESQTAKDPEVRERAS